MQCASSGMGPIVPPELTHHGSPSPRRSKVHWEVGTTQGRRASLPRAQHGAGDISLGGGGGCQCGTGHCRLMVPPLGLAQIGWVTGLWAFAGSLPKWVVNRVSQFVAPKVSRVRGRWWDAQASGMSFPEVAP